MEIGKTIRLRDYTTVVYTTGTCASACALMWIAGARRAIFDGGRVGFHAAYTNATGSPIETGLGNALVGHYLSQLGFGEEAVIFATSAPPDKIAWLGQGEAQSSGITFESIATDAKATTRSAVNAPSLPPSSSAQSEQLDSAAQVGRTSKFFVNGLKGAGYQAELDTSSPSSPRIITGTGGDKLVIAFSSCDTKGCDYAEILGQWTGVTRGQANKVQQKYEAEEQFASILYSEQSSTMSVYHYVILGKDGITLNNMIEYINYFDKEFEGAAKLAQGAS